MITNTQSATAVDEIASGIYRIHTPVSVDVIPGGFSFNQYLLLGDEPLLFHTGPRKLFPFVREAVASVVAPERLRWIGLSHYEADECGSINEWLALAKHAQPLCGKVAALVSIDDVADRPARALADGETLQLGAHEVQWLDMPHMPHGWECGYLFEQSTRTLLCGDLFTQPGSGEEPLTRADILEPSEALRAALDYYSHTSRARPLLERLADTQPATLACMHGSAWSGDGAALLRALADRLEA